MGFIELNVLNNATSNVALGIDLGTTNSLGAMWKRRPSDRAASRGRFRLRAERVCTSRTRAR
jgi:molecular chaperone DnaK (HSP70)